MRRYSFLASLLVLLCFAKPALLVAQVQTYTISGANPAPIASDANGATLQISGQLPNFAQGDYAVCFYTGYGSTATLTPTSSTGQSATIAIPASTIQSIPASALNSGTFVAHVYIVPTTPAAACNGTTNRSNLFAVNITAPFSISFSSPQSIPAGSGDTPLQIYSNSFPQFTPSSYGVCVYTGTSSAPIIPTQGSGVANLTIPGSLLQNIPLSSFIEGTYSAPVYIVPASQSCTGTGSLSSSFSVSIILPELDNVLLSSFTQTNPSLSATPPPSRVAVQGAGFTSPALSALQFTSNGAVSYGTGTLADTGDLSSTAPAFAAGTTSVQLAVCNGANHTYCSTAVTLPVNALVATAGSLTATPNPATSQQAVTLTATFGPSTATTAGALSGLVSFADAGTPLGTASLKLNPATASFVAATPVNIYIPEQEYINSSPRGAPARAQALAPRVGVHPADAPFATINNLTPFIADFNKDGIPDVLLLDSAQLGFHLLLGTPPSGNYTNGTDVFPDLNCTNIPTAAVGDLNGDGYPDIVFVCQNVNGNTSTYQLYTMLNNGEAGFGSPTLSRTVNGSQIGLGDFDKDGKLDVVVAGPIPGAGSGLAVYPGDGAGGFNQAIITFTPVAAGSQLAVADFNGDGAPDVAIFWPGGTLASGVYVFQNQGNAQFSTQPVVVPAVSTATFFTGALAAAAHPSILLVDTAAGKVGIAANQGGANIAFGAPVYAGAAVQSARFGDFSGDGLIDAAIYTGNALSILLGDGAGNLTVAPASWTASLASGNLLAGVDQNADGYADLLIYTYGSSGSRGTLINYITTGSATASFSAAPFAAGSHSLTASIPGTYTLLGSSAATTLSVSRITPVLSWSAPAGISYGTPLSSTQLNATATGVTGASLPGTFTYTPAAGTVLGVGTQTLSVLFTPVDTNGYNPQSATTTIVVSQAPPGLAWAAPSPIVYGTPLSATQLDATATGVGGAAIPGAFTYTPAIGTVLPAGTQTLSVQFTPTDQTNYTPLTRTVSLVVTKATPTLNWPTPAAVVVGTVLSSVQLNATAAGVGGAALQGAFVYTPAAGTVLGVGTQTLSVTFTPTDITDYNVQTATTTIAVSQSPPTLAWATPAAITYGTPLSSAQLNATATGLSGAALPGTFLYTPAAGAVLPAGTQTLSVRFTPTDQTNYTPLALSVGLVVSKATPTLAWAMPANVVVGTTLSSTQLNATATGVGGAALPGVFTYTPPAGTVITSSTQTLSVLFTPTDAANYTTASRSVQLGAIALSLSSIAPATAALGDSAATVTLTGSGFLTDSVVQVNGTAVPTTYVSGTTLMAALPKEDFQTVQTLHLTVVDPTQGQTSAAQNFTVTAPAASIVFTGPSSTPPATQPSITFQLSNPYPVVLTGTVTLTFASSSSGVDDPAIQFAQGGRTLNFSIPANSTTTPSVQLQTGTVAGSVTLTLALTAGGANVTPATLQPIVIQLPAAVPSVTSATLSSNGGVLTVTIHGFSNTREISQAKFHFTTTGTPLDTPDVTVPAGPLFTPWYSSTPSQRYGSTFTYTQTFTLSDNVTAVTQVTVTLTNSVGSSTPGTTP